MKKKKIVTKKKQPHTHKNCSLTFQYTLHTFLFQFLLFNSFETIFNVTCYFSLLKGKRMKEPRAY